MVLPAYAKFRLNIWWWCCHCGRVAVLGAVPAPGDAELEGPLLYRKQQWRHTDCSTSDAFWLQERLGGSQREVLGRDTGAHSLLQQSAEVAASVRPCTSAPATAGQAQRKRGRRTAAVRDRSNWDLNPAWFYWWIRIRFKFFVHKV